MNDSGDELLIAIERGDFDGVKANIASILVWPAENAVLLVAVYQKLRCKAAFLCAVFFANSEIFEMVADATICHVSEFAICNAVSHAIAMNQWKIVDSIVGRLAPNFSWVKSENHHSFFDDLRLDGIRLKHMKRLLHVKHNIAV